MLKNISSEEVKKLMGVDKNNPNFTILDVRTKEEFNAGHIENAANIGIYSLDFAEQIEKLDKNKIYLVYCQKGGLSASASKTMEPLGFQKIYNLERGFGEWETKGYPVQK